MKSDNERDITTTPTESQPDGSDRTSSASNAAVDTGIDSRRQTPSSETGEETAGGAAGEVGGRAGPDPARYGDWEKNGRCIDF